MVNIITIDKPGSEFTGVAGSEFLKKIQIESGFDGYPVVGTRRGKGS